MCGSFGRVSLSESSHNSHVALADISDRSREYISIRERNLIIVATVVVIGSKQLVVEFEQATII